MPRVLLGVVLKFVTATTPADQTASPTGSWLVAAGIVNITFLLRRCINENVRTVRVSDVEVTVHVPSESLGKDSAVI